MTQRCPRCGLDRPLDDFAPSNRGRAGTYCRPCRRERYREVRPASALTCATCGVVIEKPVRSDQRFCSTPCRAADARARRQTGEAVPPRRAAPRLTRAGEVERVTCTGCGQGFSYIRVGRPRQHCDRCRMKRGRARPGAARYGITIAEARAIREQAVRCDICGCDRPQVGFAGWHIDHDHRTGALRGVLCGGCNVGLGHFQDDPERLERAAAYLRSHART